MTPALKDRFLIFFSFSFQDFVNNSRFDRKDSNAQSKRCRFALKDSIASAGNEPG